MKKIWLAYDGHRDRMFWKVTLSGLRVIEASDGENAATEYGKIVLVDQCRRLQSGSGIYLEEAIEVARDAMPKEWEGKVVSVEQTEIGIDAIAIPLEKKQ